MNTWWLVAGLATAAVWAVHTFVGQGTVARPLTAAGDLEAVPKWTQFYCWHLVTITLAVMALGFGYAAFAPTAADVAATVTALAIAFGLFGLVLPGRVGQSFATMPQGPLLLPIGLLGLIGMFARG